jgi:hypothetical protein
LPSVAARLDLVELDRASFELVSSSAIQSGFVMDKMNSGSGLQAVYQACEKATIWMIVTNEVEVQEGLALSDDRCRTELEKEITALRTGLGQSLRVQGNG